MNKSFLLKALCAISLTIIIGCEQAGRKEGTPSNQVVIEKPEILSIVPNYPSTNNMPVVSGTAQSLVLVKFYSDSACTNLLGIGNSIADSTFSVTVPVPEDKTTTIYANSYNGTYFSECSTSSVTYVEDSVLPLSPVFTSVNPASPAESFTPTISGTTESGATVKVYTTSNCTGGAAYTVVADGSGVFTVSATVTALSTTTFYGISTDSAGNSTSCSSSSITYTQADLTAPQKPVIVSINPIGPANNNNPVISGTGEANSVIKFYKNSSCTGVTAGSGTVDGSGNFSLTASISNNTSTTFWAKSTDAAGNGSICSTTSVSYVEDSLPPAVPAFAATNPLSPSESFTTIISGTTEIGATVKLYTTSNCTGTVAHTLTADGAGTFSVGITVPAASTTTYYGTATDAVGNVSACTVTPVTYTQEDLTPPVAPFVSGITPVGPSDVNSPIVSGTAEANTTIKAYTNNTCSSSVVGTGTVDVVGDFSINVNAIDNTPTTYWMMATDANNNNSPCSGTSVSYTAYSIPEGMGWFTGTTTLAPSSNTNLNQTTAYSIIWSSGEFHSTYFDHSTSTNPEAVKVKVAGNYLLNLTIPVTSSVSGVSITANVRVNGVLIDAGVTTSGYISNVSSQSDSSAHLVLLLPNLNVDDIIDVTTIGVADPGILNVSGVASMSLEYIDATKNIFFGSGTRTTNFTDLNRTTSYPIQWTSVVSNGIYGHDNTTSSENIVLNSGGHYLAYINVPVTSVSSNVNVKIVVKLNGLTLPFGNASQGIITGGTSLNSSIHWYGLLPNIVSGTILTVEAVREAASGTVTVQSLSVASIYLEQVPSTGIFFARSNSLMSDNNWNSLTTGQNVNWSNEVLNDTSQYTHSVSTNPDKITLLQDGDYMVTLNVPLTSTIASSNVIASAMLDDVPVTGAETKSAYISNSSGHIESSDALMFMLRKVTANQSVNISALSEGASGTVSSNGDACMILMYKPNSVTP